MKLILFDFGCPECGEFEELVKPEIKSIKCPKCGSKAKRLISPVRIDKLGMATQEGATPTSIDYFEKVHASRRKVEEKAYEAHGDYGSQPGGAGGSFTPEKASAMGG